MGYLVCPLLPSPGYSSFVVYIDTWCKPFCRVPAIEGTMPATCEDLPLPHRRVRGGLLHDITISLIAGRTCKGVAAVLMADAHEGLIWYNRRLVHGPKLGIVENWGRRAISSGWEFALILERDLEQI